MMNDSEKAKDFFKQEDIFIVDRGFRDSIEYLENLGMNVEMPYFLKKNQDQFTTLEANETRLVTKIRWVVEAINGVIKRFKYFNNIVPNQMIPHIKNDFRIICSLINRYRPPRVKDKDGDEQLANKMLNLVKKQNDLKKYLESHKRQYQNNVSTDIKSISFPELTVDFIRNLTFGVYQLKQAKSYTKDRSPISRPSKPAASRSIVASTSTRSARRSGRA